MNQDKARRFWTTVADHGPDLCAVLDATATAADFEPSITRIGRIVDTLRSAVADVDPLLRVGVDQVPAHDGAVLRIAISCNHNPEGMEAVQALVAAAPAMPPRMRVCAFSQPIPREVAGRLGPLDFLGHAVSVQDARFQATPNPAGPGTFDLTCFVPEAAATDMDPDDVPGALFANLALSMGIGELRLMTRVATVAVVLADDAPAGAVNAWDLLDLLGAAPAH